MKKRFPAIFLLISALLMAGCQSSASSVELAETVPTTEVPAVTEPFQTEPPQTGAGQYQSFQWLTEVTAEEIAFVEFINLSDADFPYRRYEGAEIQEVIDLFQARAYLEAMPAHPILDYEPIVQWPGYFSKEFHVIMKDGTAHTVCYAKFTIPDAN